jgi:hypothetical protein
MEDKTISATVLGHEIVLREVVANVAGAELWLCLFVQQGVCANRTLLLQVFGAVRLRNQAETFSYHRSSESLEGTLAAAASSAASSHSIKIAGKYGTQYSG